MTARWPSRPPDDYHVELQRREHPTYGASFSAQPLDSAKEYEFFKGALPAPIGTPPMPALLTLADV